MGKLDSHMQISEVITLPQSYAKINSKWLKDLTIRHETIRLPEENIGKTFSEINLTNVFLDQPPKAKKQTNKINKQDPNLQSIAE